MICLLSKCHLKSECFYVLISYFQNLNGKKCGHFVWISSQPSKMEQNGIENGTNHSKYKHNGGHLVVPLKIGMSFENQMHLTIRNKNTFGF